MRTEGLGIEKLFTSLSIRSRELLGFGVLNIVLVFGLNTALGEVSLVRLLIFLSNRLEVSKLINKNNNQLNN